MNPHDAKILAFELMRAHCLIGWRFKFDHARRRFGCCKYAEKTVTLSRPLTLMNDEGQVRDTLLHEIAHALTPGDGHGELWKRKCREIGANPKRCFKEDEVNAPTRAPAPYRYGCPSCTWWVERRRLSQRRFICAKCRGTLVYEIRQAAAM
jgi:predicted SprT family Zn-dependent metalloprotease